MVTLLRDPAVTAAWDRPSALKEFSIHGLAGHLAFQIPLVSRVLESEPPDERPLPIAEFFARAESFHVDIDAGINVRIRHAGEALAASGAHPLADEIDAVLHRQRSALDAEPTDRVIAVRGIPLSLDDFLVTRMLEIVVHSDDLAVSADITPAPFPPQVFEPVLDVLSRLAVIRHGQPAVLRTLSRTERTPSTIAAF